MKIYFQDKLEICDKSFHKTKEGFLMLDGIISRSGEQAYLGVELELDHLETIMVDRPVKEVIDAMSVASFINVPVTDDHPKKGKVNSINSREITRGMVVDASATESGSNVKASMLITDQELIEKIELGKRELSAGYSADVQFSDDGKTAIQTNIRGNHVAFVDQGRCGRECKILDSKLKPETRKMAKIKINDVEIEINDSAAAVVQTMVKDNAALLTKVSESQNTLDAMQGKMDAASEEIKTLKSAALTDADIAKAAEALVTLHANVALIDKEFDCKGKTSSVVMKEVITKSFADSDFKDKSEAYIEARFDALVDSVKARGKDPLTGEFTNNDHNFNDGDIVAKARAAKMERDKKRNTG